jgi:hypothetical protein
MQWLPVVHPWGERIINRGRRDSETVRRLETCDESNYNFQSFYSSTLNLSTHACMLIVHLQYILVMLHNFWTISAHIQYLSSALSTVQYKSYSICQLDIKILNSQMVTSKPVYYLLDLLKKIFLGDFIELGLQSGTLLRAGSDQRYLTLIDCGLVYTVGGGRFLDFLVFQPVATGSRCKMLF